MTRYHFSARNAFGYAPDEEGKDLASLDHARAVAIEAARSLISADVRAGTLDRGGQIEISDALGAQVAIITFAEAIEIKSLGSAAGDGS